MPGKEQNVADSSQFATIVNIRHAMPLSWDLAQPTKNVGSSSSSIHNFRLIYQKTIILKPVKCQQLPIKSSSILSYYQICECLNPNAMHHTPSSPNVREKGGQGGYCNPPPGCSRWIKEEQSAIWCSTYLNQRRGGLIKSIRSFGNKWRLLWRREVGKWRFFVVEYDYLNGLNKKQQQKGLLTVNVMSCYCYCCYFEAHMVFCVKRQGWGACFGRLKQWLRDKWRLAPIARTWRVVSQSFI